MSISPFEHPFLSKLLGDEELATYFSVESDLDAMVHFERALAKASAELGIIPPEANLALQAALDGFTPDVPRLNDAIVNDGVVIPDLIAQMRSRLPKDAAQFLHFGATSQDVIDSSLMLRLSSVIPLIERRLDDLISQLGDLENRFGANVLMGHTRMQPALTITVADRLRSWKQPLVAYSQELRALRERGLPIQFGGAVGTLAKFGDRAAELRAKMAEILGLVDQPQWHCQRSVTVDIAHLFAKISGSLGKIGQDVALLAQGGSEIAMAGGGSSSAMPHKQNPVSAEILVTQAHFTAILVSGSYHSMVHEQERSGSSWTLEWMVHPQIVISCGASMLTAARLLSSITRLG